MSETTEPFSTRPSSSGNANGRSTTTGLNGTKLTLPDGRVVIEASEQLTATRVDGLDGTLNASCTRTQAGDVIVVEQRNYSYKDRELPVSTLYLNARGFPAELPDGLAATEIRDVIASQFGKNDREDEGTGSPTMGLIQTNSEVFGASLKISIMRSLFGTNWTGNEKRLVALAEILNEATGRAARVPLVDVGPGEAVTAEVDLTWACDQFLGTQGQASVHYRVLMPE